MSKGTAYEPTITVAGTVIATAITPPVVLVYSKALEPKISVAGSAQTVTPGVS